MSGFSDGTGALAALTELAEAEATALRTGNLAVLEGVGARKSALMDALRPTAADAAALAELQALLKRNAQLYQAALSGIAQARSRLASAADGGAMLRTYDRTGHLDATAGAAGGLARRV